MRVYTLYILYSACVVKGLGRGNVGARSFMIKVNKLYSFKISNAKIGFFVIEALKFCGI